MEDAVEETRDKWSLRLGCLTYSLFALFGLSIILAIVVNYYIFIAVVLLLVLSIAVPCWGAQYIEKKCEETSQQMQGEGEETAIDDPQPLQSLAVDNLSITDIPRDQTKDGYINDTFIGVTDGSRFTFGDIDIDVPPPSYGESLPMPIAPPPSYEEVMNE